MPSTAPVSTRRPPRAPKALAWRKAFTLVELIVAISVLSLMLFLAARIFFDAQAGVQRGLQTSQIIAESRSITQPIADDFRAMNVFESRFGTNTPGFLAIVQQDFPGVRYPVAGDINVDRNNWPVDRDADGNPNEDMNPGNDDRMRSDQIAFFRDATDLESLTPGQNDRFDSQARARFARIWYGHVWPAQEDVPAPADGGSNPGAEDYDLATDLIIGRQALLLIEEDPSSIYPNGDPGNIDLDLPLEDNRIAQPPPNAPVSSVTFRGGVDTLDMNDLEYNAGPGAGTFTVYDDGGTNPTAGNPRALFRTPTPAAGVSPGVSSRFGLLLDNALPAGNPRRGLPTPEYAAAVLEWLYVLNPTQRLQALTFIENDFDTAIFPTEDIGRLHAAFAPHVADFIVEFAADWSDDFDDSSGTRAPGPDGQPDGEPDRDSAGNLVWYTAPVFANPDGPIMGPDVGRIDGPVGDYNSVGNREPSAPVTYPIPDNVPSFDGVAGGTVPVIDTFAFAGPVAGQTVFVWSHTGDEENIDDPATPIDESLIVEGAGKYWPYLIRFRYRLMDGRGEFRTIETNPDGNGNNIPNDPQDIDVVGRWFELIVPVPRPRGLS